MNLPTFHSKGSRNLKLHRIRMGPGEVTIIDPTSTFIEDDVQIGDGTVLYPNTYLYSGTRIGKNCTIYPEVHIFGSIVGDNCTVWPAVSLLDSELSANVVVNRNNRIVSSVVGKNTRIESNCVIKHSCIEEECFIGPFAYLREYTHIKERSEVANVEIVRSIIGVNTKIKHGRYIGDATIGDNCNIGAGTVICNYDGVKKHATVFEDDVFIGSGNMVIAPRRIEKGAKTGAGSVLTKDIPPGETWVGNPARRLK